MRLRQPLSGLIAAACLAVSLSSCASTRPSIDSPEILFLAYQDSGTAPLIGRVSVHADGCIQLFNTRWKEYEHCLQDNQRAELFRILEEDDLLVALRAIRDLDHDERFADFESLELSIKETSAMFVFDEAPPQTEMGPLRELLEYLNRILEQEFGRKYDFRILPTVSS